MPRNAGSTAAVVLLMVASGGPWSTGVTAQETPAPNQREAVYKRTPEGELTMRIELPTDWRPEDRRAAIVFFSGGAWKNGNTKQFEVQSRYLADRGMVAARAEYRDKTKHRVTPLECAEDAKSAVRWLRQHAGELGIDPDRIAASGGSAGGHLAACTSLCPGLDTAGEEQSVSSQPNALVLFNPVLDLTVERLAQHMPDRQAARSISPGLFVEKGTPPTILFYGSEDWMIEQGKQYVARMRELGNVAELKTTPGQGHAYFNRSPHKEQTLREADLFLVSLGYLSGSPTIEVPAPEP